DGHSRTKPITPVVHRCEIQAVNGIFVGRRDGLIHKVNSCAAGGGEGNYIVINMSWIGGQGIGRNDRLSDRFSSPKIMLNTKLYAYHIENRVGGVSIAGG